MLSWFYGVLFESWWNGQTPGKRVLGLRVVSVDGRPINAAQATIRNFVRVADFFPFASTQIFGSEQHMSLLPTFIIALICMVMTRRFQRLGDLAAGTMVVVDERAWYPTKVSLDDVRVASLAEFIPASFRMSSSLARTIALYVERRPAMSARRREAHAETLAKPMLQKFGFREDTSSDLLLCAIYYREFFQDSVKNEHSRKSIEGSPLSVQGPPVVPDALPEAASVLLEAST